MNFNINEQVLVKLTDKGRAALEADHVNFWCRAGKFMPYTPPKEDAEGWSKWQLWSLMSRIGPHLEMGFDNCMDTTIQLILPKTASSEAPKSPLAVPAVQIPAAAGLERAP